VFEEVRGRASYEVRESLLFVKDSDNGHGGDGERCDCIVACKNIEFSSESA
jgi:hypothetical protein